MRVYNIFCIVTLAVAALAKDKDDSNTDPATQHYDVYGSLTKPLARDSTNFAAPSNKICGGTNAGAVHLLTSQNLPNRFEWYIHTSFPESTCQLRVSEVASPSEKDFRVVYPIDDGGVNHDGSFPCGRTGPTVESRVFEFDANTSCDRCTLEWIWRTPKGDIRQCSDIMITGGDDSKCFGLCQNGGVCSKGRCICPHGYTGKYCENTPGVGVGNKTKTILLVVLAIILILILIFWVLYYFAKHRVAASENMKIYHENNRGRDSRIELNNQVRHQKFEDEQENDDGIHRRR